MDGDYDDARKLVRQIKKILDNIDSDRSQAQVCAYALRRVLSALILLQITCIDLHLPEFSATDTEVLSTSDQKHLDGWLSNMRFRLDSMGDLGDYEQFATLQESGALWALLSDLIKYTTSLVSDISTRPSTYHYDSIIDAYNLIFVMSQSKIGSKTDQINTEAPQNGALSLPRSPSARALTNRSTKNARTLE